MTSLTPGVDAGHDHVVDIVVTHDVLRGRRWTDEAFNNVVGGLHKIGSVWYLFGHITMHT